MFSTASLGRAALIGALFHFGSYGQVFVLSLLFQQARGESALKAGLSFLPMTVLVAVSDVPRPRVVRRIGSLTTIVVGELALAAGFGALVPASTHRWWAVALAMLPIGIGAGVIIVPLTDCLLGGVPMTLAGVASGAFNASRQVGAAIGVALLGAILAGGHEFIGQARLAFILAAAPALLAVPVAKGLRTDEHEADASARRRASLDARPGPRTRASTGATRGAESDGTA